MSNNNVERKVPEVMDFTEHKSNDNNSKPALANKLEKEAEELLEKRRNLTKNQIENELKEAEQRRQVSNNKIIKQLINNYIFLH